MKITRRIIAIALLLGTILVPCAILSGTNREHRDNDASEADALYNGLSLHSLGLKKSVFDVALAGFKTLSSQQALCNPGVIAIADLSQPSTKKRLYVIDLANNKVLFNTWVAHGKNTGSNMAAEFSNKPGSLQSSIGFYLTGESYQGQHGLSLRLHGLEAGYNDKAYERAIVIHGAGYVNEQIIQQTGRLGRSFGCPAVAPELAAPIISTLGEGAVVFVYYPDRNYLNKSRLAMLQGGF